MRSTGECEYKKKKPPSPSPKRCINSIRLPIKRPSTLPALKGSGIYTYFQQREQSNDITNNPVDGTGSSKTYDTDNNSNAHLKTLVFLTSDEVDNSIPQVTLNRNVVFKDDENNDKRNQYLILETNERKNSSEQIQTPIPCTLTSESNRCVISESCTYKLIEQAFLEQRRILEHQHQKNARILDKPNNKIGRSRHNKRKKWKLSTGNSSNFPSVPRSSISHFRPKNGHISQAKNKIKSPPTSSFSQLKNASFRYINAQPKPTFLMQNQIFDQNCKSRNLKYTNNKNVFNSEEGQSWNDCPMCRMNRNEICQSTYGDLNDTTQIFSGRPYDSLNSNIIQLPQFTQQDKYRIFQKNSNKNSSNIGSTITDKYIETIVNNACSYNQNDFSDQYNAERMYVFSNDGKPCIAPNRQNCNNYYHFNQNQRNISSPDLNICRCPPDRVVSNFDKKKVTDCASYDSTKNLCTLNDTLLANNMPKWYLPVPNITKNIPVQNEDAKTRRNLYENTHTPNLDSRDFSNSIRGSEKQVPNLTKNTPAQHIDARTKRSLYEDTRTPQPDSWNDFSNSIRASEKQVPNLTKNTSAQHVGAKTKLSLFGDAHTPNQDSRDFSNSTRASEKQVPNLTKNTPAQHVDARTKRSLNENTRTPQPDSWNDFSNSIPASEKQVLNLTQNTPAQHVDARTKRVLYEDTRTPQSDSWNDFSNSIPASEKQVPNLTKNTPVQNKRSKRSLYENTHPQNQDGLKGFPNTTPARDKQVTQTKSFPGIDNPLMTNNKALSKEIDGKPSYCTNCNKKKKPKARVTCMCSDFSSDTEINKLHTVDKSIPESKTYLPKIPNVKLCYCQIKGCNCRYPPAYKQFTCAGNMSGFCNCNDNNETNK